MGSFYELYIYIYICKCCHNSVSGPLNIKFNINKKTDLTFYLGKICHYFRIVECLTSHFIDSGFIEACSQKNSNHSLRILSLLVSLYFLVLICDSLSRVLQIQIQSCPIAHLQIQKLRHFGEPYLGRQKVSHAPVPVQSLLP